MFKYSMPATFCTVGHVHGPDHTKVSYPRASFGLEVSCKCELL